MRPNIDISHTLGGRVKDWAEENDVDDLSEAYTRVLEAGLESLEGSEPEPDGGVTEPEIVEAADEQQHDDALDCPDCGESFDTFDELREHMENTTPDHDR